MFEITQTPVSQTITHMAELLDAVASANHFALGQIKDDITPFHSRVVPSISVHDYLQRIAKFVCLENDTLLAVLVYLDRIGRAQIHRPSLSLSPFNIHRLVITAIIIAHKFNSDIFFNNARYAKVGGIPLGEMNQLELEMLFLMKFDLKVDVIELEHVGKWLITRPHTFSHQHPPFSLLTQYYGDSTLIQLQHCQHPTPLLDPSAGAPYGAVPPLKLASCLPHSLAETLHDAGKQDKHKGSNCIQSRTHTQPSNKQQSTHGSAGEMTTPTSINTVCQSSTPLSREYLNYEVDRLGAVDVDSSTQPHLPNTQASLRKASRLSGNSLNRGSSALASPSFLATNAMLTQKRRRLHLRGVYPDTNSLSPSSLGVGAALTTVNIGCGSDGNCAT
ncbi:cyclin-domain-containing protein [Coemansia reversa NRRL 1564]|uniref:Cyclin-domain-containing protein n=1 Tax=Coemansia reversa (strain ATCC 12441 / NRRL 1564) TaxID=763665 RepID=A0A2G5BHR3_COERN|nr:cyclin-domain-containing protein [Coemansia reversa NRRL 1564]|eukprot:PIA18549.1 cyclin-domain-containing protein [Coemansia reversa NRRL 1564]